MGTVVSWLLRHLTGWTVADQPQEGRRAAVAAQPPAAISCPPVGLQVHHAACSARWIADDGAMLRMSRTC